ncbi:hypothetical protein CFC21_100090 [Triticum aestivum]|uniref:F-box domain-containing protein n=2 Tax=Triticum aestivum TaxID=4565 RepID=A0A3B6RRA0_WHEAT|nr:hypothetical protein CFC21_100090 [Triticum aestivum]
MASLSPKRRRRDLDSAATEARTPTIAVSPSTDVIFEILSWLPPRSLGRCRCVSRNWRDIISNPAFVAAHMSRAEPLLVAKTSDSHHWSLQLMDTEGTPVRVSSLAGAWTFQASLDDLAYITFRNRDSVTPAVVNLATGVTLTNLPKQTVLEYYTLTYMGFGRTAQSGVYKLLRLRMTNRTQTCDILTVGDNVEWRRTRPPPMIARQSYASPPVALDGALHVLSRDENCVLCFDLESEKWQAIHGPQGGVIRVKEPISIAQLNGTLCIAQMEPYLINIWLLSDSKSNVWVKAYTIPTRRKVVKHVLPLRVLRLGGGLIFYFYGNNAKPKLKVYNPSLRRCTAVKTPANLIGTIGLCSADIYSNVDLVTSPN